MLSTPTFRWENLEDSDGWHPRYAKYAVMGTARDCGRDTDGQNYVSVTRFVYVKCETPHARCGVQNRMKDRMEQIRAARKAQQVVDSRRGK